MRLLTTIDIHRPAGTCAVDTLTRLVLTAIAVEMILAGIKHCFFGT